MEALDSCSRGVVAARRAFRVLLACALATSLAPVAAWAQVGDGGDAPAAELSDSGAFAKTDVSQAFEGLVPDEDYVADELLVVGDSNSASVASELAGADGLLAEESDGIASAGLDVSALASCVGATVSEVIPATGHASEAAIASADGAQAGTLADGDIAVLKLPEGCDIAVAAQTLSEVASGVLVQPNYLHDLIDGEDLAASDESVALPQSADASAFDPAIADLGINSFASLSYVPNDPALKTAADSWQLSFVGAYDAWSLARANRVTTVAAIDSGVRATHQDLAGVLDVADAYNSCTDTAGIDACEDTVSHGTHVAGAIGAVADNGLGTAGTSFGARVLPIKCTYSRGSGKSETKAPTTSVVRGIRYALTKDVQVINLSIGSYNDDDIYRSVVEEALAANISVVCAAGNNGGEKPYYPSDLDGVISVTAVDSAGVVASFSNHNEHKTIAAPGKDVYGLKCGSDDAYGTMSGTSMAAPIVSGALALLRVANPHITAKQAEQALISTAKDAGDAGFDPYYGWGIMQLNSAVKQVTSDPVRGFSDMDAQGWYTADDEFGYAVSMGLISGYSDGSTFGPYDGITRGQVATILWRMAGQPEASAEAFDDVDYGAYYGSAITWARSASVVSGFSGTNSFGPDKQVTREELACMLANYASVVGGVDVSSTCAALDALPDAASVEAWARTSMGWCMDVGVLSGVASEGGERFACPFDSAWRVSMACMATSLMRDVLKK